MNGKRAGQTQPREFIPLSILLHIMRTPTAKKLPDNLRRLPKLRSWRMNRRRFLKPMTLVDVPRLPVWEVQNAAALEALGMMDSASSTDRAE